MKKEIETIVDENGKEYELEFIKDIDYKEKKYAVLYDEEECLEDCDCEDECECQGRIYIFEVNEDKEGNRKYNEIDESEVDKLIPIIEKELYPE